jgi:hypothetical protein
MVNNKSKARQSDFSEFGQGFNPHMAKAGYTQSQLARAKNYHPKVVNQWMRSEGNIDTLKELLICVIQGKEGYPHGFDSQNEIFELLKILEKEIAYRLKGKMRQQWNDMETKIRAVCAELGLPLYREQHIPTEAVSLSSQDYKEIFRQLQELSLHNQQILQLLFQILKHLQE